MNGNLLFNPRPERSSTRRRAPAGPKFRCTSCNCRVNNKNIGGSNRSSFRAPVWCNDCADAPSQLHLVLER